MLSRASFCWPGSIAVTAKFAIGRGTRVRPPMFRSPTSNLFSRRESREPDGLSHIGRQRKRKKSSRRRGSDGRTNEIDRDRQRAPNVRSLSARGFGRPQGAFAVADSVYAVFLNAEAAAAAAGFAGVRIRKDKSLAVEPALVVERHAEQIKQRGAVDDDLGAI